MKLHSGIRKNTQSQQSARSTLCRMEQRLPAKKLREFAAVLSDDFCRLDAKTGSTTISILGPNYEKKIRAITNIPCSLRKRQSAFFRKKNRFVSVFTVKNRALLYEQRDGISGALYDWHAGCEGLSQN